jgi:hypothetical protein
MLGGIIMNGEELISKIRSDFETDGFAFAKNPSTRSDEEKRLLDLALNMNATKVNSVELSALEEMAMVLSQYVAYLKVQQVSYQMKYGVFNREFGFEMDRAQNEIDKRKTVGEKQALIMEQRPELKELYEKITVLQAKKTLLDGMVDSYLEILYTVKKFIDSRRNNKIN